MPPFQTNQPQLASPGNYQFQHPDGTFSTGLTWHEYRRLVKERIHGIREAHRALRPPVMPAYEAPTSQQVALERKYPRRPGETPLTYAQRLDQLRRQGERRRKALRRL